MTPLCPQRHPARIRASLFPPSPHFPALLISHSIPADTDDIGRLIAADYDMVGIPAPLLRYGIDWDEVYHVGRAVDEIRPVAGFRMNVEYLASANPLKPTCVHFIALVLSTE